MVKRAISNELKIEVIDYIEIKGYSVGQAVKFFSAREKVPFNDGQFRQ